MERFIKCAKIYWNVVSFKNYDKFVVYVAKGANLTSALRGGLVVESSKR